MGRPATIKLTHPTTKETYTVAEWAKILKITSQRLRQKYYEYLKGQRTIESVLSSHAVDPVKRHKRNQKRAITKKTYVFRPEYFDPPHNTDFIGWEAYDPEDLESPILTSIVQSPDSKGFVYNCYPFGVFHTKNELVRAYLKLKAEFGGREDKFLELSIEQLRDILQEVLS